jgi:hypothetical protein
MKPARGTYYREEYRKARAFWAKIIADRDL